MQSSSIGQCLRVTAQPPGVQPGWRPGERQDGCEVQDITVVTMGKWAIAIMNRGSGGLASAQPAARSPE